MENKTMSEVVDCSRCQGTGTIWVTNFPMDCPACDGKGLVVEPKEEPE